VPGPRTAVFVLAYVLTAGVASAAYLRWRSRRAAAGPAAA
jgi:hypothetical protein